jgi:hypothetical protein
MPLFDVVDNTESVAPEHMGATGLKVGIIFGLTAMVKVVGVAH